MSNQSPNPAASTSVLLVCLTVAFGFVMAAVIAVVFAVPEGGNPGSLITILLASFTTLVPTMVALVKITTVARQVNDLSNGLMDAKIRAGAADVIKDEHLDPDAAEQIAADRQRRGRHAQAAG